MTEEGLIKSEVVKLLQRSGYYVIRNLQGGIQHIKNHPGISDLTAIRRGKTSWIEIKVPGKKQRPGQIEFQHCVELHGGEYVIFESLGQATQWVMGETR